MQGKVNSGSGSLQHEEYAIMVLREETLMLAVVHLNTGIFSDDVIRSIPVECPCYPLA